MQSAFISFEVMLLYLFLNVPVIPVAMFSPVFYRTRGLHGMVDLISNAFLFYFGKNNCEKSSIHRNRDTGLNSAVVALLKEMLGCFYYHL